MSAGGPWRIFGEAPTPNTVRQIDEVVCLQTPELFHAIGSWYEDFSQTTDQDVRDLSEQSKFF